MELNFEDNAIFYVSLGWQVFPLAAGEKVPAIKGGKGCKDATDDPVTICRWHEEYPGCNIGIACGEPSGIVVVDFDPRHGGLESAKKFRWPQAPLVRTQSGGFHLFFAYQPGIRNSAGKIGRGIDVRSTGGYVVAAPSVITATGGRYQWVRVPRGTRLPRLPADVLKTLEPAPKPVFRDQTNHSSEGIEFFEGAIRHAESQGEGNRNNALFWAACRLAEGVARKRVGQDEALRRLVEAGQKLGLPQWEIEKCVNSAFGRVGQ